MAAGCTGTHQASSDGLLPSQPDGQPGARVAESRKASPAGDGLSVVVIPNVASNTWMVSDGAGGEWTSYNDALVRIDDSTYAVSRYSLSGSPQVVPYGP